MNGDALTNIVAIADFNTCRFTCIFQILVNFTDGNELKNAVVATNFGHTIENDVSFKFGTFTDFHLRTDKAERTDMNTGTDNGTVFNNSAWMNKGGFINHVLSLPAAGAHH